MQEKKFTTQQQLFVRKKGGQLSWLLVTLVGLLAKAVRFLSLIEKVMGWLDKFNS